MDAYGVQPVDHREFEAQLKLKATTKITDKLEIEKANALDHEQLKLFAESLQNQIDQFLLVIIDYFRNVTADIGGSSQKDIKRATTFMNQLFAMYRFNDRRSTSAKRKSSMHIPKLQNKAISHATIEYSSTLKKGSKDSKKFKIGPINSSRRKTLRVRSSYRNRSNLDTPSQTARPKNLKIDRSRQFFNQASSSMGNSGIQIFLNNNAWTETMPSADLNMTQREHQYLFSMKKL